jgi:hypothetical protein
MRYIVSGLILALLLGACSPGGTISPVVEQAAPASPTVHIAIGEQVSPTSQPAVAPTSVPPATAVPTPRAPDDKPTAEPQAPAATRKEVVWNGLRFQYDPQRFRFAETALNDGQAYAAVSLIETPNPCLNQIGTDCTPGDVQLRLYSRDGLDFWAWLAQQQIMTSYSPQGDFVDLVIAGRPAVAWPGDGIFFGSYGVYAVSIGEDVLLINGVDLEWFLNGLQLEHPTAEILVVGQIAMTTPDRSWDLWSDAVGGARIDERPRLYGGALVTILATEAQAVQVRTAEGLTGWIQAAVTEALTTPVAPSRDQARFMAYAQARIAEGYTIPLRESPRSTAATQVQPAKSGQEFLVMGVRGDWLRVFIPEVGEGWARWYYDGAQYIEFVEQ